MPVNPFANTIVMEPRDAEPPVPGLNDHALRRILGEFDRLEGQPPPRTTPLDPQLLAQLVISPEPGYGKSHLIGRLFQELEGRAVRVYLRPPRDAASSWRTVLRETLNELARPDAAAQDAAGQMPAQLDALAFGVFAGLTAALAESGQIDSDNPQALADALRADPAGVFGYGSKGHPMADWFRQYFPDHLLPLFENHLAAKNARLNTPAAAWLKVFFALKFGVPDLHPACLDWIKGDWIEQDERRQLGLRPGEVAPEDAGAAQRNSTARERLADLLQLAGFYKPALICFDQTEIITNRPEECAEFGRVVEELVCNGRNTLVVVTANQPAWENIRAAMEIAHHDRFSPPVVLEEIDLPGGRQLIRQRCERYGIEPNKAGAFLDDGWLSAFFGETPRTGVRVFLKECFLRWEEFQNKGVAPPPPPPPPVTLGQLFQEALAEPGQPRFDADILRWWVRPDCVGNAVTPWRAAAPPKNKYRDEITSLWQNGSTRLLFGLEDSSHAQHWLGILNACREHRTDAAAHGQTLCFTFLRTPEQRPIPGPGWNVIGPRIRAEGAWFQIRVLTAEQWRSVAAAYNLWAKATEGDVPFSPVEVLDFVRGKLAPVWRSLIPGNPPPPTPPTPDPSSGGLEPAIRQVLAARPFLTLSQLLASLGANHPRDDVLAACRAMPEVAVFPSPGEIVIQWKAWA